jgi:hypothetical protein
MEALSLPSRCRPLRTERPSSLIRRSAPPVAGSLTLGSLALRLLLGCCSGTGPNFTHGGHMHAPEEIVDLS